MPALDVGYVDHGCSIEIRADLEQGWDRGRKTYCFDRTSKLEYQAGIVLRITLQVYPRPVGLGWLQESFPYQLSISGSDPVSFHLAARRLTFRIPLIREGLNVDLPWKLTENGKFGFWWNNINVGCHSQMCYTAQILVVVHPDPPIRKPLDWVARERGVYSSHFESNRNRH